MESQKGSGPKPEAQGARGAGKVRSASKGKKKVAPPKVPKGKKPPKVSREDLSRSVAVELSKVRAVLREVGSSVLDRLDGEAAALALFLGGETLPGEKAILPSARALKAMQGCFATLKVKAKRGRIKDLARIESLLSALAQKMPPQARSHRAGERWCRECRKWPGPRRTLIRRDP
jgi:hypothetical protein